MYSTGHPVIDAQDNFARMRRQHLLLDLVRRVGGEDAAARQAARLAPGVAGETRLGTRMIKVEDVVGSVDKAHEFDREFRPRSGRCRSRWAEIATLVLRGDPLPPILVYDAGGRFFVQDGHHRVSVARALGIDIIEAQVQRYFPDRSDAPAA